MTDPIVLGTSYSTEVMFRRQDGSVVNPDVVTMTLQPPVGDRVPHTFGISTAITNPSTGLFRYTALGSIAGIYLHAWKGSGASFNDALPVVVIDVMDPFQAAAISALTQDDLERHFPPDNVRTIFSDDGSGNAGPRLKTALLVGFRGVQTILLKAWTAEQILGLVLQDEFVKAQVCALTMVHGCQGRIQWVGKDAPYEGLRKTTTDILEAMAEAQKRSVAEQTVGKNPNLAGRATHPEPKRIFAPTGDNPRRGGY
jgi:hypothetical protein